MGPLGPHQEASAGDSCARNDFFLDIECYAMRTSMTFLIGENLCGKPTTRPNPSRLGKSTTSQICSRDTLMGKANG
jgi:hypothetical protein